MGPPPLCNPYKLALLRVLDISGTLSCGKKHATGLACNLPEDPGILEERPDDEQLAGVEPDVHGGEDLE